MKYVHSKNMLSIWEEFLELFKDAVLIDQKREYIYMTSLLWYTGNKVSKDEQSKLIKILARIFKGGDRNSYGNNC
ncbi:putative transposase [Orientia chuto str. Dubai]|uniref:Putative transposase n=1 Tax=Orientia chuto str. Dubai TaxID=1359168 RepID=A0A0F3MGP7_9RICK|nr:putative transposase [Orientia chuto str. Dubai]